MESRVERIVLETDGHRIVGDLTLPREGYRSRLSDFLNQGERDFIALANAIVTPLHGGATAERAFVAVGRAHVRVAHLHDPSADESGDA